ncbi:MAG TPA: BadF/BadG/BcrA/BcrD ATPase family protein [Opitutaceae bacterium]|jgi:glucosamine kinase|nr:BadF/BadG/BcrA/BcrD ATPase family protein [Opitutaceae bacterium]
MKIGIDGGGTKTECILIDARGEVLARHTAPGCNPSIIGPERARETLRSALRGLAVGQSPPVIVRTLLCMAGNRTFWQETAAAFTAEKIYGPVKAVDDSLPVIELATGNAPGLVLHAGTGSFVAARDAAGKVHYAGGLGWRLGDPGSGYELGRLAIVHALIELQGWAPPSRLSKVVRDATQLADAGAITRFFYQHADSNQQIAALAPAVLRLAAEDDPAAHQLVLDACQPLLDLAQRVAARLFPDTPPKQIRAGLSGPILTHPAVTSALAARSPLSLFKVAEPPIEGVRRLLLKR